MLRGKTLPILIVAMSLGLTVTAAQAQCIRECEGFLEAKFSYQPDQTHDVIRVTNMKIIAGSRLIREGRGSGVPNCNTAYRRQSARRAACGLASDAIKALYANNLAAAKRVFCEDTSPALAEVRRAFRVRFDNARPYVRAVAADGTVALEYDAGVLPLSGEWFTCARAAPPPPPTLQPSDLGAVEHNTDRVGGDYQSTNMDSWSACATACAGDAQCKAWTWVKAGIQGPSAKCWLKSTVPAPRPSDCCISGVK